MDKKRFKILEIAGIGVCAVLVLLLWQLYPLSGMNPIGVLFGSVNGSIWETLKPLILSYFVYGGVELFAVKPYFKSFVAAKALGLYALIVVYILFSYILPINSLFIALIAFTVGFFISKILTLQPLSGFFITACFMLLLIFVMYFSFSAYPPRLELFRDPSTSLYGIIPDYIDEGATELDKFFSNFL